MGLFEKLIKDGWWKEKGQLSSLDPLKDITSKNWDELLKDRTTVVTNDKGEAFRISIPIEKPFDQIRKEDFEISKEPIAARDGQKIRRDVSK
jgi:hypothetical protein